MPVPRQTVKRYAQFFEYSMKFKLLLLLPFFICGYGFLPVSFRFDKSKLSNSNTLLVRHQECGCPCPSAYIKQGQIIVPYEIQNKYSNIDKQEINITGRDPFEPYDPELARQDIMVSGKVVAVDTVLCDQSGCEVVPVFKVNKWDVESYYPRLWTHGRAFLVIFLLSALLSVVIALIVIVTTIKKAVGRRVQS
jgi:hypothetical protein